MLKFLPASAAATLILAATISLQAQPITQTQISIGAPHVINFSDLAAWEKANPKKVEHQKFIEQGEDRDTRYRRRPGTIAGSEVREYDVPVTHGGIRTTSPAPNIVFDGTLDNGNLIPPDINLAVGTNWVMETNNQQYDIYNKTGTLITTLSINTFYNSTGGGNYFVPHVVYDAAHQRFIAIIDGDQANGHGGIFIGVSQTSNPTGSWYIYSIDGGVTNTSTVLLDYPLIGFNKNWVVITGNLFTSSTTAETRMWICNRASMYAGTLGTVTAVTDQGVFALCPSTTTDTTVNTLYMVAEWWGDSAAHGYCRTYKITGTPSSPSYSPGFFLSVNTPWDENSVGAPQLNSSNTIEDGDTRISNAVFDGTSLWWAHTVFLPNNAPTRDVVQWWQVNPATGSITQFGRIQDPTGNIFYYYPSLAVNSYGHVLIGHAISSASMYASAAYAFRQPLDPVNTFEDSYIFRSGLNTYYKTFGGTRNRWGDYTGCVTDPVDQSFWTFQEFAQTPANTWATVVANTGGTPCSGTPVAGTITASPDTLCPGSSSTLSLSGASAGQIGIAYQWQESPNGVSGWVNATGNSTNDTYVATPANVFDYYRCTISCVNSGQSATTPVFTLYTTGIASVSNDTVCTPGTYTLIATAVGNVSWYVNAVTPTVLQSGNNLTVTTSVDTTFYVSANISRRLSTLPADNTIGTSSLNTTFTNGETFTAISNFTIDTVFAYPGSTGTIHVNLVDSSSGATVSSATLAIIASQVGQKVPIPLTFNCVGGTTYNMNATGTTNASGLQRNSAGAVYPYTIPGVLSINHAINNSAGRYYFFYDWRLHQNCTSTRIPVNMHVGNPVITLNSTADTVCTGTSVTMTASGANTYSWMPGSLTGNSVTLTPASSTTYTVTGTIPGCSGNSTIHIQVVSPPTVNVTATDDSICSGTSMTLSATGANTYSWTPGSGSGNSITVSPTTTTTYTVTGSVAAGCSGTTTFTLGVVTVNVNTSTPVPNDTICLGTSATLNASGAGSYTWMPGSISGNGISVSPTSTTTYTVTGTGPHGCTDNATVVLWVKNCNGIPVVENGGAIKISPNPAGSEIKLTLTGFDEAYYSVSIENEIGQRLMYEAIELTGNEISLSFHIASLPPAVYFIHLYGNGTDRIEKFVKE